MLKTRIENFIVGVILVTVLFSGPIMFLGGGLAQLLGMEFPRSRAVFFIGGLMSINTIVFYWLVYRADLAAAKRIAEYRRICN